MTSGEHEHTRSPARVLVGGQRFSQQRQNIRRFGVVLKKSVKHDERVLIIWRGEVECTGIGVGSRGWRQSRK